MYPSIKWDGDISANCIKTENTNINEFDSVILFSGGLDSLATSQRHIDDRQLLLAVCGADVRLTDDIGWNRVKENTEKYTNDFGGIGYFVKSNFKQMIDASNVYNNKLFPDWWTNIQHGIALCGFMSIPSYLHNVPRGYIGASHTNRFSQTQWGSHPLLDENVSWTGFNVVHDSYDLSRQEKLSLVVDKTKNSITKPVVRVCYSRKGGGNCCKCEKCSRTITGLIACGQNPRDYGFEISPKDFIRATKLKFKLFGFNFKNNEVYHWNDIISSSKAENVHGEYKDYYLWLSGFDFESYKSSTFMNLRLKLSTIKILRKLNEVRKVMTK
jgi:hypothetical protein